MEEWHDFFLASARAAAALKGLLFVGLSINLSKILAFPVLADRALLASILLLSILVQSLLLLVPHETVRFAGICILIAALQNSIFKVFEHFIRQWVVLPEQQYRSRMLPATCMKTQEHTKKIKLLANVEQSY